MAEVSGKELARDRKHGDFWRQARAWGIGLVMGASAAALGMSVGLGKLGDGLNKGAKVGAKVGDVGSAIVGAGYDAVTDDEPTTTTLVVQVEEP